MGDIDFDELDKAVNSLMSNTPPATQPATNDPDEKPIQTVSIRDSTTATPQGIEAAAKKIDGDIVVPEDAIKSISLDTPPVAPAPLPVPATPVVKPVPTIQKQNSGRYMDVMRPSETIKTPVLPEPEHLAEQQAPIVSAMPKPAVSAEPPLPAEPVVVTPPVPDTSNNRVGLTVQPPVTAAPPAESASFSPFLPNPQVEKRPLGPPQNLVGAVPSPFDNPTPAVPPTDSTATVATPSVPDPMTESKEEPTSPVPATLPINNEEVKTDNNGNDSQRSLNASDFEKSPTSEEQKLQQLESNEISSSVPVPGVEPPQSVQNVESGDTERIKNGQPWQTPEAAPVASPELPKSDDQPKDNGIYDVSSYHEPLKHIPKEKSGWWVVIAIILVIILCASVGVAAFFVLGPGI